MSEPTKEELAKLPDFIIRYMAPMSGPGRPYREEWMRRELYPLPAAQRAQRRSREQIGCKD